VTATHIIYARRLAALEYAAKHGPSAAAAVFGVTRQTITKWRNLAQRYGLSALLPKARRAPQMPNQTPPEEVSAILAEAVANPTLGARQLLVLLAARGIHRSASGVQKVLRRHHLATRARRVAALATITAAETGQVTDAARRGPFGFCLYASTPGQLVALDTFYVGRLKGVGAIWQFTAVDTATRWAVARLICGEKTDDAAAAFLHQLRAALAAIHVELTGVLTDRGPEFIGRDVKTACADLGVEHTLTPPRSPNHNAVVERFQGTCLHEFYRPHFHRGYVTDLASLDTALQRWIACYNRTRANHGDYMQGRTPGQRLRELQTR
jgi:transposase InsO family protein